MDDFKFMYYDYDYSDNYPDNYSDNYIDSYLDNYSDNYSDYNSDYNFNTVEIELFMPLWRRIMWISLFSVITVVGTVGNFTIIWIVVAHKNMRSVINLLVVNLAIADGLVTSLVVPFYSFQLIHGYWPFGAPLCKIHEILASTNIGVSILTLSVISIDRYRAIMYPFKRRMGRGKTITVMVGIWLMSLLILSPNWYYTSNRKQVIGRYPAFWTCIQTWPDRVVEQIYRFCLLVIIYFLPLTCLGFSYGSMAVKLWGHETIGEHTQCHLKGKRDKRRIVKMFIMVVFMFAICWLPFHLMFIIKTTNLFNLERNTSMEIFVATVWLAMSNSMSNPTICCAMNARFRAGFKKAYRWCPCIRYDPVLETIHFSQMRMSTETD